jgi:hypothetical protein
MARMIDQITGVISQVFLKRQNVAQHCNPNALSHPLKALVANQELKGSGQTQCSLSAFELL